MFNLKTKPIVVEVHDDRWDAYAQNATPTFSDRFLLGMLYKLGGVSNTVPAGCYHFGIVKATPFKFDFELTPVEN